MHYRRVNFCKGQSIYRTAQNQAWQSLQNLKVSIKVECDCLTVCCVLTCQSLCMQYGKCHELRHSVSSTSVHLALQKSSECPICLDCVFNTTQCSDELGLLLLLLLIIFWYKHSNTAQLKIPVKLLGCTIRYNSTVNTAQLKIP